MRHGIERSRQAARRRPPAAGLLAVLVIGIASGANAGEPYLVADLNPVPTTQAPTPLGFLLRLGDQLLFTIFGTFQSGDAQAERPEPGAL